VSYQLQGQPFDIRKVPLVSLKPVSLDQSSSLLPKHEVVKLKEGQSRRIRYHVSVPAGITPVDVYFLIDVSSSMQDAINGTRVAMQSIVEELASAGLDVRFGVGSFRSFTDPPVYDRGRDIGPADANLARALNELRAQGGGAETQMEALLESVDGTDNVATSEDLRMHFRPGSLRIAILTTDEEISQGAPHPTYDTVAEALLRNHVKQVGIAVQDPPLLRDYDYNNPGPGPAEGLQVVARKSGTVAPAAGVDCDGDGTLDLYDGDPVVCMLPPANVGDAHLMSSTIVNVVNAVDDIQNLNVTVAPATETPGGPDLVQSVDPAVFPNVDLKLPNERDFAVTVRCPSL
jgi:hypothetical protein